MVLHPDSVRVLDGVAAAGIRPWTELTPAEARTQSRTYRRPDPNAPSFETLDMSINGRRGSIPLRIYPGASSSGVLFLHGGGWMYGDLDMADGFCRFLTVASKATVISVDYRLAPEHPYPAPLDDAVDALQWMRKQSAQYGIDGNRIAVCGSSAGGNLAAAACLRLRAEGQPLPRLQILLCPALDAAMGDPSYETHATGGFLTRADMAYYWDAYRGGASADDPYVSPLAVPSVAGLPPALVVTAGHDPLRDEGERYARRLAAEGIDAELLRFDGQLHAFPMNTTVGASHLVVAAIAARLDRL